MMYATAKEARAPVLHDIEAEDWRLVVPTYRLRERAAGAALLPLLEKGPNLRSMYAK